MSGSRGKADAINATAAIQFLMSAFGGEADVRGTVPKSPLIAKKRERQDKLAKDRR
jgi:hypothetical protein